ncbi:hypothetical protein Tco_0363115 [Tanacetum coccineum]
MAEQDIPPPTITAMKIPIIRKGEYDIWSMRMRQYICHTDHNLWDVIVNRDLEEEPAPTRETSAPPAPKTAKQLAAKRNQEKQLMKDPTSSKYSFSKADKYHAISLAYNRELLTHKRADISLQCDCRIGTHDEDDVSEVQIVSPIKTNETQTVKTRVDQIGYTSKKAGIGFKKIKACFVFQGWLNQYGIMLKGLIIKMFSKYLHFRKTFVPSGVLTRTGLITPVKQNEKRAVHKVSTARPLSTARPVSTARSYYTKPAFRPKDLKQDVKTFGVQKMTTAGTRAVVNTGKGKMDTDLKKSRYNSPYFVQGQSRDFVADLEVVDMVALAICCNKALSFKTMEESMEALWHLEVIPKGDSSLEQKSTQNMLQLLTIVGKESLERDIDGTEELLLPDLLILWLTKVSTDSAKLVPLGKDSTAIKPLEKIPPRAIYDAIQLMGEMSTLCLNRYQHETQPDPSPRPSPTIPIPDSIPEGSGGNHGGQSSSDRSLSGNEDGLTLQSVYDLCVSLCKQVTDQAKEIKHLKAQIKKLKKKAKPVITHHKAWMKSVSMKQRLAGKKSLKKKWMQKESVSKQGRKPAKSEPTVHKDPAFDDLDDVDVNDAMDYMETDAYMQKGVSTEDQVSTVKPDEGTDKPKVSTDKPEVSTAKPKEVEVSTDKLDEDDETIAEFLVSMSQTKAKQKGVEIKDAEDSDRPRATSTRSILTLKPLPKIDPKDKGKKVLEEEAESDAESEGAEEAERKFDHQDQYLH